MKKLLSLLTLFLILVLSTGSVLAADYEIIEEEGDTVRIIETQAPQKQIIISDNSPIGGFPAPLSVDGSIPESEAIIQEVNRSFGKLGAGAQSGVIKNDNSLWTWGENKKGQVGNGTTTEQKKPVKVLDNVSSIAMAYESSAAITSNGDLYVWGRNSEGSVGNNSLNNQLVPVKVLDNVSKVSVGAYNTAAIRKDGSLWMWGNNYYGQMGLGFTGKQVTVGPDGVLSATPYYTEPVKIIDSNVTDVSLGQGVSACVKSDGTLWTWGCNESSQLGNGGTNDIYTPTKVSEGVKSVSMGLDFGIALKNDGTVVSWGANSQGELGIGSFSTATTPTPVAGLSNVVATFAQLGNGAALTSNGDYYCWGYNRAGAVGDGTTTNRESPIKVATNVDTAAIGLYHQLILKNDGSLWATGSNDSGVFGDGSEKGSSSFIKVLSNLTPDENYEPDTFTGTFIFDRAYSQILKELQIINAERAKVGASPLAIDQSLTESAMERAGEIHLYFDHERPNGEKCFSLNPKMFGENILVGSPDVEDAMDGWMNSPGHRANILNSSFKSVGIGIAKIGYTIYYVQCFGYADGTGTPKSQDETVTQPINGIQKKYIDEVKVSNDNTSLNVGEKKNIRLLVVANNTFARPSLPMATTSVNSSNSSVVSVTGTNGTNPDITLTALKEGTSKVSLNSGTFKYEATYTVGTNVVDVTKISLDKTSLNLKPGDNIVLNATVEPSDATDRSVSWNSSNTSVATVDQGSVKALADGSTVITVSSVSNPNITATCSVTVSSPSKPVDPVEPKPDVPDNPVDPEPDVPDNPVEPDPDVPDNPVDPKPDVPDNPVEPTPDMPDNPNTPTPNPPITSNIPVYRLYNAVTGEHLYTSDKGEYDILTRDFGWTGENIGWNAPSTGTPVYRLYNSALADHLYSTDPGEVAILTSQYGWQVDYNGQPLFYSGGSTPVYRLYNSILGRHHLTKDKGEYDILAILGWNQEGQKMSCIS